MPRVIIPFPLRQYANDEREVVIDGSSLKEAMEQFLRQYPAFERLNQDSTLLSIFVNSQLVRTAIERWDTLHLNSDDEITLIIPIAGG